MTNLLETILNPFIGPAEPVTMDLEVRELHEGDVIDYWLSTNPREVTPMRVTEIASCGSPFYRVVGTLLATGEEHRSREYRDTVSRNVIRHH